MKKTVVKEGPLVFVARLILAEIALSVFFYSLSFLEDYEFIYKSSSILSSIRYDILLMILFSSFQIILIMTLFVYWYFSYYEIGETEIIHAKGIIKRRRKSYLLDHLRSIDIRQNILERLMSHASMTLYFAEGKDLHIRNIGRFEEARDALHLSLQSRKNFNSLKELLTSSESDHLEFKETLRFDVNKNLVNKEMEKAVLKTIAGFLNSKGGTLLVGVNDKGELVGLKRDYQTLKKQGKDGFQNYLMVLFKEAFGAKAMGRIIVYFEEKDADDICVVHVLKGDEPVFLKNEGKEDFYVRSGNGTHPLSMSEAQSYIKQRFG